MRAEAISCCRWPLAHGPCSTLSSMGLFYLWPISLLPLTHTELSSSQRPSGSGLGLKCVISILRFSRWKNFLSAEMLTPLTNASCLQMYCMTECICSLWTMIYCEILPPFANLADNNVVFAAQFLPQPHTNVQFTWTSNLWKFAFWYKLWYQMENCICLLLKLTFFQHLELKNREWFWQRNWNNSAVSNAQFFLFILQKLCWMEDSPRLFNVQTHTHTQVASAVFFSLVPPLTHTARRTDTARGSGSEESWANNTIQQEKILFTFWCVFCVKIICAHFYGRKNMNPWRRCRVTECEPQRVMVNV